MTWDETIALLHGRDWKGVKAGLDRISELLDRLENPQKNLRFIHIAGTNGKGSAAAMLSAILTEAGYCTGRYISPHLIRMNERYAVDGREISDEELRRHAAAVRAAAEGMNEKPTNFELITALGFLWFAQMQCELVVLEVGLGGRFDATNVIDPPLAALIMHIGLEHTAELGNTPEEIAREKAGIIKPGTEVILYAQSPEVVSTVERVCTEKGACLTITDPASIRGLGSSRGEKKGDTGTLRQRISYRNRTDLSLSLLGDYQTGNAAVVLDAVDILVKRRGLVIPEEAVRRGLQNVRWPGRFQVLGENPLFVIDGAHNPNGVQAFADSVARYFGGRKLILLMGVMADKNVAAMLSDLAGRLREPDGAEVVTFIAEAPKESRAMAPERLRAEIEKHFSCPVVSCGSSAEGIERALEAAKDIDDAVILAFGSLYLMGEILAGMQAYGCGHETDGTGVAE